MECGTHVYITIFQKMTTTLAHRHKALEHPQYCVPFKALAFIQGFVPLTFNLAYLSA